MTCREHDWSEVEDTGGRYAICTGCNALGVLRNVKLYGDTDSYADCETFREVDMHQVAMVLYHAEEAAENIHQAEVIEYLKAIEG